MAQVSLQVADEVKQVVDGLMQEWADIKAQKGLAVELTDAMPIVMAGLSNYQKLAADIKSADNIAYLVLELAKALLPAAPAPAPAA